MATESPALKPFPASRLNTVTAMQSPSESTNANGLQEKRKEMRTGDDWSTLKMGDWMTGQCWIRGKIRSEKGISEATIFFMLQQ